MSITFDYVGANRVGAPEACLCAQMAPSFGLGPVQDPSDLRKYAHQDCPTCNGTGIDPTPYNPGEALNLANMNAAAFLDLLNLENNQAQFVSLPVARRAVLYARNTFERRAPPLQRESFQTNRVYSMGLDTEKLSSYLDRFERLIEAAEKASSEGIVWG